MNSYHKRTKRYSSCNLQRILLRLVPFLTLFVVIIFVTSCDNMFGWNMDNPIDPDSEQYIGTPSIDRDGDGIGSYEDIDEIELVSPSSGSIIADSSRSLSISEIKPGLIKRYWIQIATDKSDFENTLVLDNNNWEKSEYPITLDYSLLDNTTYYWRAKANDGTRWSNNWSPTWSYSFINTLSLNISTDGNGLTVPEGDIFLFENDPKVINAEPSPGYVFKDWTVIDGTGIIFEDTSSANTNLTLTDGPAEIRANFDLAIYELTVSASIGGTVTPSTITELGHNIEQSITASADSGYVFTDWSIVSGSGAVFGDINDPSTTIILLERDVEIQANFNILRTLTIANDGHGTTIPSSGDHSVGEGVLQTITATPSSGYGFSHWSGSGSVSIADINSSSTTVSLTGGDGTVTANFSNNVYALTVNADSNGTTTPLGTINIVHGVATDISAVPTTAGYELTSWSITSGTAAIADSDASSTTVTLTDGAATIQAIFGLEIYALTMTDNGFGSTSASTTITYGVSESITATPDTGYNFVSWSVTDGTASIDDPDSASTTVTLTEGAATLQAFFTLKDYALQINNDGYGSTSPTGSQTVQHAVATDITATPSVNYIFNNWSVDSGTASIADLNAAITTVTLSDGSATIKANFLPTYTLTVSDDGNGSTTPSGSSTVTHNEEVAISATPLTGYDFDGWSSTYSGVSFDSATSSDTTVVLSNGDAEITANFTLKTYILDLMSDGYGTTSNDSYVYHGIPFDIEAEPYSGYQFDYWSIESGDGITIDDEGEAITTATLTNGNASLKANFTQWPQISKLLADDRASSDKMGHSISIFGDYAIIGAPFDDDNGSSSGSAYIFHKEGAIWSQQAKLLASDGFDGDQFGYRVSISGDYAIIGAYGIDDNGSNSGAAYIFFRDGTSWAQQAKITGTDVGYKDSFGASVSISGNYAVIGATGADDNDSYSGAAYIFVRSGTTWYQQAKLLASDGAYGDTFGYSVSISGDYAIIGAHNADGGNGVYSGSAYIFSRSGSLWIQQAKLLASDGAAHDSFGRSVSISGNYAIVGAPNNRVNGILTGSSYIFARNSTSWTQQAKIHSETDTVNQYFGNSVSISGDTLIVGAYGDYNRNEINSGAAFIFSRSGSAWILQSKLLPDDGAVSDNFGYSVSISDNNAAIASYLDDSDFSDTGSAYIFEKE
jgi:FG-GAP repeat/Divergent InlB B-repeat domain